MSKIIILIAAVLLLVPPYFMVIGSFQDIHGVFIMPPRPLPLHPTLENYRKLLSTDGVVRWAFNSVFVVACVVVLSVIVAAGAGYAFSAYRFPLKRVLWMLLLMGIMVPRISAIVPLFVVINRLKLSGTMIAAVLPVIASPINFYLARTYFESIPKQYIESARIDGASETQVLANIIVPVARPIIATIALFSGIAALGDYIWQMLILQDEKKYTLIVGLTKTIMKRGGADMGNLNPIGQSMAAGCILLLPILAIFLVANKYFTQTIQGVKD